MSNTHKHEANTVDEILDRITQDGRYSSAKEFSILFVESQDELGGLSPIQFRKAKAKQQIQALITEEYRKGYTEGVVDNSINKDRLITEARIDEVEGIINMPPEFDDFYVYLPYRLTQLKEKK